MSRHYQITPGDGDPAHYTDGGYTNHGCRGDCCRRAHTEKQRKHRATAKLGKEDPRHGTPSGYTNFNCRCDRCKKAYSDYHRSWRAGKTA